MKESILDAYKNNKKTYHAFRERIINLLNDLLSTEKIVVHQLVGRTKSLESLSKKIDDKNGKYNSVDDITDIIGIRIITYLESDIDPIAELIEKEFIKDIENSIDKRKLQADRFGYKSLHVVVGLNDDRTNLKEYKRYKDLKCEIQIRSILQHAWAEIEHDLGYKGEISVPEPYKRSFNRLSALLETADIEFVRLKQELEQYENNLPNLIKSKTNIIDINSASLKLFMRSNSVLQATVFFIKKELKWKIRPQQNLNDLIEYLDYFEIVTINKLENSLKEEKEKYLKFVKLFLSNESTNNSGVIITVSMSAPLLYFTHYLAGKSQNEKIINDYLNILYRVKVPTEFMKNLGNDFINIYNQV